MTHPQLTAATLAMWTLGLALGFATIYGMASLGLHVVESVLVGR